MPQSKMMENIQVIIAEKLQLTRLGLSGIIYQTRISVNIREVADSEKFKPSLLKDGFNVLITSKSFLHTCNSGLLKILHDKRMNYHLVIINDIPEQPLVLDCDDIIEYDDSERIIFNKLECILQKITSHGHTVNNDDISQREKEVLKLVALGMTNREIAEKLFISSHTVITHRKNITAKLGIKTIAGLTVYAVINKLISAEELK